MKQPHCSILTDKPRENNGKNIYLFHLWQPTAGCWIWWQISIRSSHCLVHGGGLKVYVWSSPWECILYFEVMNWKSEGLRTCFYSPKGGNGKGSEGDIIFLLLLVFQNSITLWLDSPSHKIRSASSSYYPSWLGEHSHCDWRNILCLFWRGILVNIVMLQN